MIKGEQVHLPRGNRKYNPVGVVDLVEGDMVRVVVGRGRRQWYKQHQLEEAEQQHAAAANEQRTKKAPKPRRPMTKEEMDLVGDLARCSMRIPWDRRFVREMATEAAKPAPQITDGQGRFLFALRNKYRLQLGTEARA